MMVSIGASQFDDLSSLCLSNLLDGSMIIIARSQVMSYAMVYKYYLINNIKHTVCLTHTVLFNHTRRTLRTLNRAQ